MNIGISNLNIEKNQSCESIMATFPEQEFYDDENVLYVEEEEEVYVASFTQTVMEGTVPVHGL
jgi:hypothetical protein